MPVPQAATKRSRNPELGLVLIALGIGVLVVVTGNSAKIFDLAFNRTALFIAVVMLVEYVVIKGFDRSAQYRRQLESSQAKRREDLLALQRVEQKLATLQEALAPGKGDPASVLDEVRDQLSEIRSDLATRG